MNGDEHTPSVTVIAEAGVNHNGQPDLAWGLLDAAARAGAHVIKYQTFRAEALATPGAAMADYQQRNTGATQSQLDMLRRLELPLPVYRELRDEARRRGLRFLSTAFDLPSLRLLVDDLGLDELKVASGELTNAPLLLAHARSGARLIVSTGMATLGDVEAALGVVAFGRVAGAADKPSPEAFRQAYASREGQAALRQGVTLLHCTSQYPAPMDQVNLRAMVTLSRAFGLPVGYSDHTMGIEVALAAAALGATVIEKHLTLDRTMPGPDHAASLEPDEMAALVRGVAVVSAALGDGVKRPQPCEEDTARVARKSLVAVAPIRPGDVLDDSRVGVMRPGDGMSPLAYWHLLGRRATRAYEPGDMLDE
ncbi:N-acetylneuraminate synthase [Tepidimonas ignava]|uniref:N,N'-diacetyllegionaminic acid synthase n=1 Tax=Tepidimonas ignava TaxID=114249 RepID=A0A4V2UVD5_9BURK|nr:N-acetylneuraminate synthase [Tepidimonas ignava]TCS95367.1 N-acetylneuraminate synthase [Tepidimonas ignava]TSE19979.1 N,N'-diacetyllegionaminic acid synthase [Tepidimonas ignava]